MASLKSKGTQRPWWEQVLRGERDGVLAGSIRQAAKFGSWGYHLGMKGRELAYQRGWLPVKRLPQPTICVGNITVGGTGKTPLVIRLATDLLEKGLRPAILLRGYKREQVNEEPVLVRDPKRIRGTIREAGDEAMELAVRLNGSCIGVGADRYAVGQYILDRYPVDCFILDDGFQHHRLDRDINLVTLDVADPWGGGKLLPAGLLREKPEALRRADAVILTRTSAVSPDRLAVLREEVSMFMREKSFLLESRHEPRKLVPLGPGEAAPLSALKGKQILAVSGIGNPQSFESSLIQQGAMIAGTLRLADHGGTPRTVWNWIHKHRRLGQWVVMTEKDAMRWSQPRLSPASMMNTYSLRMDLVVTAGQEQWKHLVNRIYQLRQRIIQPL